MDNRQTILLKLTGEILRDSSTAQLDAGMIRDIARQIKELSSTLRFALVIGGGNFFRGSKQGKQLGLQASVGHQIGMLATMMNGLIIKDIFEQENIPSTLFCAVPSAEIGNPISHQSISKALAADSCPIFTGGTGNPFFTTDTTAVLRGLQIGATAVWKGTTIDGIYEADPRTHPNAQFLSRISYQEALERHLGIMDSTAFALAKEHRLKIRVFNIFSTNALIQAAHESSFGSTVF
jgi:uridylate kinase